MPRLIYAPEGGERQEFQFDPLNLVSVEAEAIEEAGGSQWDTYGGFFDKLQRGGLRAWRAVLWVMLRRTDPSLQFSSLVVKPSELIWELDDDEDQPGKDEGDDSTTDSESPPQDSEQ